MTTLTLTMNSDRKAAPDVHKFRTMTRDEILALRPGQHPLCVLNNGKVGVVKVNGAVKTWVRDPNRVEVPVKYGMYECARLSLDEAMRRFVIAL